MAHVRQSRPDSGLAFQVKVVKILLVVHFSLGSGDAPETENEQGNDPPRPVDLADHS